MSSKKEVRYAFYVNELQLQMKYEKTEKYYNLQVTGGLQYNTQTLSHLI